MSLQFKPEDDFKIDNIITATANKKGIISTNGVVVKLFCNTFG